MIFVSNALNNQASVLSSQLGKKLLGYVGALLSLTIVCLALWVMHHTLQEIQLADVLKHIHGLSISSILLALAITIASYLLVTGYDFVALRHINRPVPYRRSALTSFLASTFGNNIGFAAVTGTSIRYRMYSQVGLSALEIAGVSAMCALTTMLGMGFIFGFSMFFGTGKIAESAISMAAGPARILGGFILSAMAVYVFVASTRHMTISTRNWSFALPSGKLAAAQIALASTNLMLVGTLIFILLPTHAETDFIAFLSVFSMAIIAGSASNVPGGIGVFESVLLIGLPDMPRAALLGSILLFRCVYYLTPLGLAALMLALHEGSRQRHRVERIHETTGDWLAEVGPQVMAIIVMFAAAILLFSSAIPINRDDLAFLQAYVPLPVMEFAHLAGGAAGLGLILLARGLSNRLANAHRMIVAIFGVGIAASVLKGLDFAEAGILVLILVLLLRTRPEFPRKGSVLDQGFPVEWASTLMVILAVTIWLGLFSYKEIGYADELWWRFAYDAEFSRFLRTIWTVLCLTVAAVLLNLLWPDPQPKLPDAPDLERIRKIIKFEPNTRANLALLGDKRMLFSQSGNAFIMFQIQARSWIALGDPIGPRAEHERLLWTFREHCERYGGLPAFYLVDSENRSLYDDLGMSVLELGEDARVRLETFSLEGVKNWELSQIHKGVRKRGARFEMVMSPDVPALIPELRRVSDAWLDQNKAPAKGFSRGYFEPDYVTKLPCAVVRKDGRIVAFAVLWASADKEELALDLMRYDHDAPKGVMDYLLAELMLGGQAQGYQWFNLGMAPLATLEGHPLAPLWRQLGGYIYRQSEHFQNLAALRGYGQKFDPVWRPKYIACASGLNTPRILRDIAKLIAR